MNRSPIKSTSLLVLCLLLLGACSGGESSKAKSPTPETLSLQNIPTLAFVPNTPPTQVIPIVVDDPRFPLEPDSAGKALYESHCAKCHGINGEGQDQSTSQLIVAPPHNASGHTWHHPDQQNFATVYAGRHFEGAMEMPRFGDILTEDEILSILAYIKTFWGEQELAMQFETTQAFAEQ
jgi:mono/diheme cytochrome c family protein